MKLPSGWIFILRMKNLTTIEVEERELVLCRDCIYRETEDCKWRQDESPDNTDFCSIGEDE